MTLLIVFNDDTKRRVKDVLEYDYDDSGLFKYSTSNSQLKAYWAFVPKENVRYFGPEELWVETDKKLDATIIKELEDYMFEDPKDVIESAWNNAFRRAIRTIKEKIGE